MIQGENAVLIKHRLECKSSIWNNQIEVGVMDLLLVYGKEILIMDGMGVLLLYLPQIDISYMPQMLSNVRRIV